MNTSVVNPNNSKEKTLVILDKNIRKVGEPNHQRR
jgi:hypothetical protein